MRRGRVGCARTRKLAPHGFTPLSTSLQERVSSAPARGAVSADMSGSEPNAQARRPRWRVGLELLARFVVAGLLVYAAVGKLGDLRAFAQDVDNYRIVPETWVAAVAITLPTLEIVVAAALVSGVGARGASLVATVLMFVFAAGMAQALARGIDLECGCFGRAATTTVSVWTIARNLTIAAVAAVPLWLGVTRWTEVVAVLRRR